MLFLSSAHSEHVNAEPIMCGCVSVFSVFRWTYLLPFNDTAYIIVLLLFKWELLVVLIVVYSVFCFCDYHLFRSCKILRI